MHLNITLKYMQWYKQPMIEYPRSTYSQNEINIQNVLPVLSTVFALQVKIKLWLRNSYESTYNKCDCT